MDLILITGGVRSGKSAYAQGRALSGGDDDVTFIATARPSDEEMENRIARHQRERPSAWRTVETSHDVGVVVERAASRVVVVDCITLLAAEAMGRVRPASATGIEEAVSREVTGLVSALRAREGVLIAVTNEVGLSVHPETELGRYFQDALGHANQVLARAATELVMMVCGVPLHVKRGSA